MGLVWQCDRCKALSGSAGIELPEGWSHQEISRGWTPLFCPTCSDAWRMCEQ